MNPAATFTQFMTIAEQDGKVFFSLLQAVKGVAAWWMRLVLLPLVLLVVPVLAQAVPFIFRRHLSLIFPVLPYIQDREALVWLKDALLLYYHALKGYRPFCLFRGPINSLLEELDEYIDSLTFSLQNQHFLDGAVESIEAKTSPR